MKLRILIAAFLSMFLVTSAQAGSLGLGVAGTVAMVGAEGSETNSETGTETDGSVTSASASNDVMFAEVYAEYSFGDSERFTLGIAYVPGSADVNHKNLSRTDSAQGNAGTTSENDTGEVKANAEISDHTTIYAELGIAGGVYVKYGYSEVDIDVQQTNAAGFGTYDDKTLDAQTLALGYKGGFGDRGVFKVEGFMTDYDTYSDTSTTTNTVTADLDVVGAKLALGMKF